MENFVKVYLTWGHYILAHPFTLKTESSHLILCLNKSHVRYYLCHINFVVFVAFLIWNIFLLVLDWKTYQANHNFINLIFHLLWIVCTLSRIVHHLPNSIGALEVLLLNNGLITLTNHLEKCKQLIFYY